MIKLAWNTKIKRFLKKNVFTSILVISCLISQPSWAKWNSNNELWQGMTKNFELSEYYSEQRVQAEIDSYLTRRRDLYELAKKSSPYLYYVYNEVKKRNMPGEIALIPMIESSFNPFAISRAGAVGLWQLMPGTASGLGLEQNWWYDGRRDICAATNAALKYLTYLYNYFDGDWLLAIAAYHSGEGTILRAKEKNYNDGKPTDYWSLSLPRATEEYIPRLLALSAIVSDKQKYDVNLPSVANKPYFKEIKLNGQIELIKAAKLAHVDIDEIYILNPGHNHWATNPKGPHYLVLPIQNISIFRINLSRTPKNDLVSWQEHIVKPGETLSEIATQYKMETNILEETNHLLSKDKLKADETLLIPVNHKSRKYDSKVSRQRRTVVKKTQSIGPQQIVHIVEPRDTLSNLGKKYATTSSAIRYWNNIDSNKKLKVGQKLVIWKERPLSQSRVTYYTVSSGDTLSAIATRFGVSVQTLREWNAAISNNDQIYLNQKLVVYRGDGTRYYSVQKGDTLSAIAARFNIKLSDLKQWNQSLENAKYLYPEQRLIIAKNGKTLTYVVKPGDTLSAIAQQFNVSVNDLQRWNDFLYNNKYLYPDQKLLIYMT